MPENVINSFKAEELWNRRLARINPDLIGKEGQMIPFDVMRGYINRFRWYTSIKDTPEDSVPRYLQEVKSVRTEEPLPVKPPIKHFSQVFRVLSPPPYHKRKRGGVEV